MSYVPTIEISSSRGTREVRVQTNLLTQGKIFINGDITQETTDEIIMQLMYLASKGRDITVFVNSGGGSVTSGLAICDALESYPYSVTTVCCGCCRSMGRVIFSCGNEGKRYILPHSEVMIHEPLLMQIPEANASALKRISDSLIGKREILNSILSRNTGHTTEEIAESTLVDFYMDAEEAIEFGIADKICESIYSI